MTPNRGAQFITGEDVLSSTRDEATNAIVLQLGDVTANDPSSQEAVLVPQCGFVSRPAKATAGRAAAQAYGLRQGDRDIILGIRDSRSADIYGALSEGESCAYAPAGSARTVWKKNSVTDYAIGTDGKPFSFTFDENGMTFLWPWGSFSFTRDNGLQVNHPASETSMAMGPISGLPSPADVIKGAFSVAGGICEVAGALTKLGTGTFSNAVGTVVAGAAPQPATPLTASGGVFIGSGG